jgi:hypothetical protein
MGALVLATFTVEPSLAAGETAPLLTQLKLIPTTGNTRLEGFGGSVAISGDTAIVGAGGAAFIFQRDAANGWVQMARLDHTIDPAMSGANGCGTVAISGDTAMVGCREASVKPPDFLQEGLVFVFARNQGGANAWGVVGKLTGADRTGSFGESVALDGDIAIIGAPEDDDLGSRSGSAYVFARNASGAWTQVTKLTAADGDASDLFGASVAMSGDTVIISARLDDQRNLNAGAAYVFERDRTDPIVWRQVQKLMAADGADGDQLGLSVAIDRDTVVVLAFRDGYLNRAGAAYVFERRPACASWCEVAKIPFLDMTPNIWFKPSVAISGDIAIIGAAEEYVNSGAAYVFSRNVGGPSAWGGIGKVTAIDGAVGDQFGSGIAISGDTVVLGAASIFNAGTGKAYACRIDPVTLLEGCRRAAESVLIWDPRVRQQSLGYTCCDNEELVLTVTFEAGAEIRNPFIEVSELTGGNVLKNADEGPGGVGARLTPDVGDDGVLHSGELVTVTFIIGLETRNRFGFFVNIKGESGF